MRLGAGVDTGLTPFLYAQQAGLFKKAGLDVEVEASQNGAALAAGVAGGALDIAKSSLMSLITARARGLPFKIIAGATEDSVAAPVNGMCVLKTSGLKTLADLGGKSVAFSTLRGLDMLGAQQLIARGGVDVSTVKFIELPTSAMLAGLEQGRADAAAIAYPFLPAALASGKVVTLGDPYRGIGPRLMIASWFTTDDYAARNRSVVDRFARVVRDANAYTNTHHAETDPIIVQFAHLDPATVAAMANFNFATQLDPKDVQPAIDAAAKYRYINAPFPATELFL